MRDSCDPSEELGADPEWEWLDGLDDEEMGLFVTRLLDAALNRPLN